MTNYLDQICIIRNRLEEQDTLYFKVEFLLNTLSRLMKDEPINDDYRINCRVAVDVARDLVHAVEELKDETEASASSNT